jgi:hypothetical protein
MTPTPATPLNSMIMAALSAGLIRPSRIKKTGELKKRPYSNKSWPRLRKGQPSFIRLVVN